MNNDRRKRLRAIEAQVQQALDLLADAQADLESVRDEEQEAFESMPESLQEGDRGETAQQAIECLEAAIDAIEAFTGEDPVSNVQEAQS
jgi:phytoene/squalene synthetase